MQTSLIFWILMLIWLVFGIVKECRSKGDWMGVGGSLFTFVLFLILGWNAFGAPIK